ncbi:MAG TPA: hypothetical protein DEQ02_10750 [Ruminococcaceae bacterium]|nr:hypothetical protein [Oscillospiraceae bacterium]
MIKKLTEKYKKISERDRSILFNIFNAGLIKGGSMIVVLLTTRYYMAYFGNENLLGLWFVLLSFLSLVLNFDLGIGNGLRNRLVESLSENDLAKSRKYISSAYIIIGLCVLLLCAVSAVAFPFVNWHGVFNLETTVISKDTLLLCVFITFFGILLQFFLKLISSVMYALQKSFMNSLLILISNAMQLIFVAVYKIGSAQSRLVTLSVAHVICANLPLIIATIVVFSSNLKKARPGFKYFQKKYALDVLTLGGLFFVVQLVFMLLLGTNDIFITRFSDTGKVAEYNVYQRLFSLAEKVIFLMLTPIWSAVTKALKEKDFIWMRKLYRRLQGLALLALFFEFATIPFTSFGIKFLSDGVYDANYVYALAFALYSGALIWVSVLCAFANGMGKLKIQIICYSAGAVLKIITLLILSRFTDEWIIIIFLNIIILIIFCTIQSIWLSQFFKKNIQAQYA